MKYMASAIQTALDTLDGQLQSHLTTFNGEPGNPQLQLPPILPADDAGLSAVASGRALYFGGRETHYLFPAIEAAAIDGELSAPSVGQHSYELNAPIVFVTWIQDTNAQLPTLYKEALGFTRCMLEVLLQPGSFGGGVTVDRCSFTHTAPDPEKRKYEYLTLSSILFFWLKDVQ